VEVMVMAEILCFQLDLLHWKEWWIWQQLQLASMKKEIEPASCTCSTWQSDQMAGIPMRNNSHAKVCS